MPVLPWSATSCCVSMSMPARTSKRNTSLQKERRMTQAGSVRPGGRTTRTRTAVLEAALDELAQRGWDQVSVETIAARAGVHKTTVYRRWGGKDRLVVDAVMEFAQTSIAVPDTGDVGEDLRLLAHG